MTKFTRSLVLSLIVLSVSTFYGFLINSFLVPLKTSQESQEIPRVEIFAPLSNIVRNILFSSGVSDAAGDQILFELRMFYLIQFVIFFIIVFVASIFALTRPNIKSPFAAIICGIFAIPVAVIMQISLIPSTQSRAPSLRLMPFSYHEVFISIFLNIMFYAVPFIAGAAILTDDRPKTTQSIAGNIQ